MSLEQIGSLVGMTREGVRQKLLKHHKWRSLATERLYQLGKAQAEITILKRQLRTGRLAPTHTPDRIPYDKANSIKKKAWVEIMTSSVRCMNVMERLNITSVDQLLDYGLGQVMREHNMGIKTIKDIICILQEFDMLPDKEWATSIEDRRNQAKINNIIQCSTQQKRKS